MVIEFIVDGVLQQNIKPPNIRLTAGIVFQDVETHQKYEVMLVESTDKFARIALATR